MTENTIKIGEYIVIQKQNYKKLHKLNKPNTSITLGRDTVNLTGIEGCPYHSVFKMIPSSRKGREYQLQLTEEVLELKDEIDIKASGSDNRNIIDDGRSQKLTASEIVELTRDANKAADIVETLISNSNTFHNKTEFSQEKYLKKKEKKYFEYLQIIRPNLRLIAEIMYRLDPGKIQNMRIDTLSQIVTSSNIHSEGNHLLYDSGSNGLIAAALLSAVGANTNGKLIHMHPGNMSQKQALLAMNFGEEQFNRCISVNIYSVLRQIYQGCDTHSEKAVEENITDASTLKRKAEDVDHKSKVPRHDGDQDISSLPVADVDTKLIIEKNTDKVDTEIKTEKCSRQVKYTDESNGAEPKKPKWHYDNITAAQILQEKMDSLIIACKEDPQSIFNELMDFVKPSRPFVVYFPVAEPLQQLYVALKCNSKIAALKLTCNWMRNYQVLPERTHPEVMMNNQSGFLLTGYVLK